MAHNSSDYTQGGGRVPTAVPMIFAVVALLVASTGIEARNPPKINPAWWPAAALGVSAVVLALAGSRFASCRCVRITHGLSILVALVALILPLGAYYESYHDLPLAVLIPVIGVLIIGGWWGRQRLLSAATTLLVLTVALGAVYPRSALRLPATRRLDGVLLTVNSVRRSGKVLFIDFFLAGRPGASAAKQCDLGSIRINCSAGVLLPVTAWQPLQWPRETGQPIETAHLWAEAFPPSWAQKVDLGIVVPRWPVEPAYSLTVPVPPPGAKPNHHSFFVRGKAIRVTDIGWAPLDGRVPPVQALGFRVNYTGSPHVSTSRLRVTDGSGEVLPVVTRSMEGCSGDYMFLPGHNKVESITISFYRDDQLNACGSVFHFRGIRNR